MQIQQWLALEEKIPTYKQIKQYEASNPGTGSQAAGTSHAAELEEHFGEKAEVLDHFQKSVRTSTYILWAKTYDLSWAFHVFKSMNDTGRPLTDVDKLKALILNCWKHENSAQEDRAKQWYRSIAQAGGEKPFRHVIVHMAVAHGMDKRVSLLDYMVSTPVNLSKLSW